MEALTICVDPHGGGRDVRGDGEVGDPQVLVGGWGSEDMLPGCRHPPFGPGVLCADTGLAGAPQGSTSICRSLKTLYTLLLKPAPENMEVMG